MKRVEVPSYPISIFMAGDVHEARRQCHALAKIEHFCVTVTATAYVHTDDIEPGFVVGLINYPRFPSQPADLLRRAEWIAAALRTRLGQQSYSIQTPDRTIWISHRDDAPSEQASRRVRHQPWCPSVEDHRPGVPCPECAR